MPEGKSRGFPGLGNKTPPSQSPRANISYKEMTLREHMALQLMIAMIHSDNYHYVNDDVKYGEQKYAVDAYIAADAILEYSGKTPEQMRTEVFEEVHAHEHEEEEEEDDDDTKGGNR